MEDHPVVIGRQLHVYGLKERTREEVTRRGVTHPEQRGVKRLSVRTAWVQGRPEGGAVTHTAEVK